MKRRFNTNSAHERIDNRSALCAAITLCILAGCQRPAPLPGTRYPVVPGKASVTVHAFVPGSSGEGRPIECHHVGQGEDVILIMASIHGDEPAGTPLVYRLAEHLRARPDMLTGRQVVLMAVANPDGLASGTRHNANGVDLNRNFPAWNFAPSPDHGPGPLSEPESRAIKAVLDAYKPHRVVTIHQPVACVDYDGPAENLAWAMGRWVDLPVKRIGSQPGSLGSHVGVELGIPIITLELPASASSLDDDALWQAYGNCLLAAIVYPEPLAAD